MDLSAQDIQRNIEALRNKVGDARTGGKGSQRRKVKVAPKPAVLYYIINRLMTIKKLKPLLKS